MRIKFIYKLTRILDEQGKNLYQMEAATGIFRGTVYRGVKRKTTLCAIAYYLGMKVEDLVDGTDAEDIWYQ
jgi:hypothetical protein